MSGTVKVIKKQNVYSILKKPQSPIRKVAIYARVSTDSDGQKTSIEAQKDYYTKLVAEHPSWEFAGLFCDDGISGTGTKRRTAFNQMLRAAENHEFSLIITKSISRFARNTVDSLKAIRQLKEGGVEVFFEKENVWTFDTKGELMLTILSSVAQEESRSISENVTWGKRKRFADGAYSVPYGHFLGYDKGKQACSMVINPVEAKLVKRIYFLFLLGMTSHGIAIFLTDLGIPTPLRKACWNAGCVTNVLTNEKYKGDALIQKGFTVDYITKKKKKNEGELPRYYVTDGHEAIIPRSLHDYIQEEIYQRKNVTVGRYCCVRPFLGKVRCGQCGSAFRLSCWHSTSYNDWVWECSSRYRSEKCGNIHIYDMQFQKLLSELFRKALRKRVSALSLLSNALQQIHTINEYRLQQCLDFVKRLLRSKSKPITFAQEDAIIATKEILVNKNSTIQAVFIDDTQLLISVPEFHMRSSNRARPQNHT